VVSPLLMAISLGVSKWGGGGQKSFSWTICLQHNVVDFFNEQHPRMSGSCLSRDHARDGLALIDRRDFVIHHVHSTPPLIFIARQLTDARY